MDGGNGVDTDTEPLSTVGPALADVVGADELAMLTVWLELISTDTVTCGCGCICAYVSEPLVYKSIEAAGSSIAAYISSESSETVA